MSSSRLVRLAAAASAALVCLALTGAPRDPRGLVTFPFLDAYAVSPAEEATFAFQGWVDFPGSRGHVEIDVLNFGNGESEVSSWALDVARAVPGQRPFVVAGERRFIWSTGFVQVFRPAEDFHDRWPEGGTARVRFRAVRRNRDGSMSQALLPVQDVHGVIGQSGELILADDRPNPTVPPGGEPTPNYLNRKPTGSPEQTRIYYATVGTSPTGDGPSIAEALPTLEAFKRRYFGPIPDRCEDSEPEVSATYFNRGDLGIGRGMHCIVNGCTRETACYVENFGARDGTPLFGDRGETRVALWRNRPFATVAMVERGRMGFGEPNKVFFVVYDHQGNPADPPLAPAAPLDSKAFNTFIPGNCLVCHGSGGTFEIDGDGKALVREAYFLPFDLEAFRFYGAGNADPLSRAAQEGAFKRLNRIVYFTDLFFNPDASRLLNGWYGALFHRSTFRDGFVPEGWDRDPSVRQLYLRVVAPTCRGCHISHSRRIFTPSPLRFGSFTDFESFKALVFDDVCRTHAMPNAEQTLRVIWRTDARPQLLDRLFLAFGCGLAGGGAAAGAGVGDRARAVGDAVRSGPNPAGRSPGFTADDVYREYAAGSCACRTPACLHEVDARLEPAFAALAAVLPPERAGDEPDAVRTSRAAAIACREEIVSAGPRGSGDPAGAPWERELERDAQRRAALRLDGT